MAKTFVLSTGGLNSYGFRVLTEGIQLPKSKRLTLLWNHARGDKGKKDEVLPIGKWVNLRFEKGDLVADAEFDMEDAFAAEIARKVEKEYIFEASAGLRPIEWSADKKLMVEGQTLPTLSKSRLREASIATIASDEDSVSLYDDRGDLIDLNDRTALVQLTSSSKNSRIPTNMEELKLVALSLGLSENAEQNKVLELIKELKEKAGKYDSVFAELKLLKGQEGERRKAEVKSLLDAALTDNRIVAAQRPAYEKLFEADHESTKAVLEALPKPVKLSEVPAGKTTGEGGFTYQGKTFSQLSKESPNILETLKANDFSTFNQLYKSEFGKDYKVTEK
ncbi:MAG: hypothetical protein EPGJADBJ_04471 [Saprospiraceae bacterium]|nr:hypothetical protein [Saprospiraceae bacterium]